MRTFFAIVAFAAGAAEAHAISAEKITPNGRYASDSAGCKAKDYFVTITKTETILPTFSCKKVQYDQSENAGARAVYKANSSQCYGEESTKPRKESFTVVVDAAGLQILWKDGTKSAVFTRCPD